MLQHWQLKFKIIGISVSTLYIIYLSRTPQTALTVNARYNKGNLNLRFKIIGISIGALYIINLTTSQTNNGSESSKIFEVFNIIPEIVP